MSQTLTEHDGRLALRDHLLERAAVARETYGTLIDAHSIVAILKDKKIVRYPVELRFDAAGLLPGEFAHPTLMGAHARDGFVLFVHPVFESTPALWPHLIAYHIPPINYGDIAAPADCECFGAALLGMEVDAYYNLLCDAADLVPTLADQTETRS